MGTLNDLAGKKFGRLTVISKAESINKRTFWNCRCDCGTELVVIGGSLKQGHTMSCGCIRLNNLVGEKYGRLTVIEKHSKSIRGTSWRCKCECGEETIVKTEVLQSGEKRSCGCLSKETLTPDNENSLIYQHTNPHYFLSKAISKTNTSGTRGVSYDKRKAVWRASIQFKKQKYDLGRYKNIDDAIKARKDAEEQLVGPFLEWYLSKHQKNDVPKPQDIH